MPCAMETASPRRRHQRLVFAFAAPALPLTDAALTTVEAQAQSNSSLYQSQSSNSPYQPSLTDPRFLPRFGRRRAPPQPRSRHSATIPVRYRRDRLRCDRRDIEEEKNKPKPGDPKPAPPPPPKGRGAPQAAEGHTLSQQSVVREQYKAPDTPPRRILVPIQDPHEPLGIRAGTFLLKPAIDITRGYDTNPSHIPNGQATGYTVVEPTLKVRSNWAAHEFGLDGRVNYSQFDNISSLDRPNAEAKTYMRLDASRDTAINIEGRYLLSTDYPGSPNAAR